MGVKKYVYTYNIMNLEFHKKLRANLDVIITCSVTYYNFSLLTINIYYNFRVKYESLKCISDMCAKAYMSKKNAFK